MTSHEVSAKVLAIVAADRWAGRVGYLKAELDKPEWYERGYSYDWTGYVPTPFREIWLELPLEYRALIFMFCSRLESGA